MNALNPEMSRAEYDSFEGCINWSRIRLLEKSPAHYKYGYGEDSSGFALGTAVHSAILEPEKFAADFVIYPGKVRRGKEWEAFELEQTRAGKSILSAKEQREAIGIRDAVHGNATARKYLTGGVAEFSMFWELGTVPYTFQCRGRGDYLSPLAIVDLKSTKDASPKAFANSCARYGYFGQAAWYSDGYERITGKRLPYKIIAVESSSPYVVQVYNVPEADLAKGREQYQTLLGKLDYCTKSGFWCGYSEQEEIDIEMPQWSGVEADT